VNYLLRCDARDPILTLRRHVELGGMNALKKALSLVPDAVRDLAKRAGLRGRGGAGFPAATKWGFLPKDGRPRFLVVNGDEGEPCTFKDRYFLECDPFPLLEGALIAAHAIGARTVYVYVRGEFTRGLEVMEDAVEQARAAGWLGRTGPDGRAVVDVIVHPGAGAYVCGEETALLESLEGRPGRPRNRPPFPAVSGLFGFPTIIHNVETLACLRLVVGLGAEAFAALGVPGDGGPKLYALSGEVKRPGLYEAPMGTPLRTLIEEFGGGTLAGRPIKGILPGGTSTPVLGPESLDVRMDFDSVRAAGSMLGTGAVTVFEEGTCPVAVLKRISRFYAHESCGQCTPCRDGTGWIRRIVDSIEAGTGRPGDCDLLLSIAASIAGNTICALGDAAAFPVQSFVARYRDDFEAHVSEGRCPFGNG
jgi:NADH-quinone oxidoreductase subunit F